MKKLNLKLAALKPVFGFSNKNKEKASDLHLSSNEQLSDVEMLSQLIALLLVLPLITVIMLLFLKYI